MYNTSHVSTAQHFRIYLISVQKMSSCKKRSDRYLRTENSGYSLRRKPVYCVRLSNSDIHQGRRQTFNFLPPFPPFPSLLSTPSFPFPFPPIPSPNPARVSGEHFGDISRPGNVSGGNVLVPLVRTKL